MTSITILDDAVRYVARHPEMFLRGGVAEGSLLASAIVEEALLLTDGQVTAFHREGWWIIASDADWLSARYGASIEELFTRIVPFLKAGTNDMRREVLLTAFARSVVTIEAEDSRVVKGDPARLDAVRDLVKGDSCWKRIVAFQV